ncbi:MAG TPA: DUF2442 domain-containing protein [Phycisphaerae bacterium]|nr:DUF2442 domain-containing protein [Phycisphaerae bacterium]
MHRITEVRALSNYTLRVRFADGTEGTVDLADLAGQGVFALWDDYEAFRQVRIGRMGQLQWGDEIELCPDSLYLKVTGKRPEDIFPTLGRGAVHA